MLSYAVLLKRRHAVAKISIDVDEIKSVLKNQANNAKTQITELARQAQKDLSEKGVLKKVDQVIEIVKSQEFMKNPKVAELAKKIVSYTEQIEKLVTKNANQFVDEVKSRVNKTTAKSAPKAKKTKKASADSQANAD